MTAYILIMIKKVHSVSIAPWLNSEEVIRPQVPLRPPCYDFSPLTGLRFDAASETVPHLNSTWMERRAVCARSGDVFIAR